MRTAYRCRAYPDEQQQAVLLRTFGCVRVVWNRTLADRRARWHLERRGTSYAETDRALTAMKKDPEPAFLNEVPSVPLQQALRHQHAAYQAFFARRARHPRFKSRRGRQSAHYTRSAFALRGGVLRLAKIATPLQFVWSWPDIDPTALDPAMVILAREPDGRWYVTFTIDMAAPAPLEETGRAAGIDLGVRDFAVTSNGQRIANPRRLARKARNLARYQRRLARCQNGSNNRAKAKAKVARAHRKVRARHDRDINAARNILAAGRAVARGSPGDACGGDVRHSGSSRVQSPANQESSPRGPESPSVSERRGVVKM
jgi:putative transposase